MKKLICASLAVMIFVSAAVFTSGAYVLPSYYDTPGHVAYDAYRIYVDLAPGFCSVFDELDYDSLFEGAEFVSICDSDAAWREAHPEKDVFPDGYDAAAHVRRLTVELYEEGVQVYIFASKTNAARVEKALSEFEAFDFVSSVRVVPTQDFDPYGYEFHDDDAYLARIAEMNEKYGSSYEDYVEYCKPYLSEFDVNGDGLINYDDVFRADRAKTSAIEAGGEYAGAEPAKIINFLVTAPGRPYEVMKYNFDIINARNVASIVKYIEICERDGVEYLGPTKDGFILRMTLPYSGNDGSHLIMGDANGDDSVNARDVVLVMKSVVTPNTKFDRQAADVNCDGKINGRDVILVMKIAVNGSIRAQSKACPMCRMNGHMLTASYATETVHNAYADSPHCVKKTYLVISCGREGCDYIEKILVSSKRTANCHG